MKRKWFQLVEEDGNTMTSVDYVRLPDDAIIHNCYISKAVFAKVSRALPSNVIAPDLTIFATREAFSTKYKLPKSSSSVAAFGFDKDNALIVQAPSRIGIRMASHGVVGTSLPYAEGINPTSVHFPRDETLTRMAD